MVASIAAKVTLPTICVCMLFPSMESRCLGLFRDAKPFALHVSFVHKVNHSPSSCELFNYFYLPTREESLRRDKNTGIQQLVAHVWGMYPIKNISSLGLKALPISMLMRTDPRLSVGNKPSLLIRHM